jgi:hypothetical protein
MAESQRIRDERNGLAVLKKGTVNTKADEKFESLESNSNSIRELLGEYQLNNQRFKLQDLVLYIRHIIASNFFKQDMDTFLVEAEVKIFLLLRILF